MTNYKITYSSELYHHGILGQKWGVRRFQNPDGSLTAEGRKRYGYKELRKMNKERAKIGYDKNLEILKSKEKEIEKYKDRAWKIADKYELDADDGGGGNTQKFTEAQLEKASKKFWEQWDAIENIENSAYDAAREYANNYMMKKYGNEIVSELDRNQKQFLTNAGIFVASIPLAIAIAAIAK